MTDKRDLTGASGSPAITEAKLREALEAGKRLMDSNPGIAMAHFTNVLQPLLDGALSPAMLPGRICALFPGQAEQDRVSKLVYDAAACAGYLLWASPSITSTLGFNAATLLEFAANNGNHPDACYHLSDLHSGRYADHPRHAAKHMHYLNQAASLGHERAMMDLGLMYLQAEQPNVAEARRWLNQCAALEGVFQPIALQYAQPLNRAHDLHRTLSDERTPLPERCGAGWELWQLMGDRPGCCTARRDDVRFLTSSLIQQYLGVVEPDQFTLWQKRFKALQQL